MGQEMVRNNGNTSTANDIEQFIGWDSILSLDNVHFQNSAQLVKVLTEDEVEFRLQVRPISASPTVTFNNSLSALLNVNVHFQNYMIVHAWLLYARSRTKQIVTTCITWYFSIAVLHRQRSFAWWHTHQKTSIPTTGWLSYRFLHDLTVP